MPNRRDALRLLTQGTVLIGARGAALGADPWTESELVKPAVLAKQIESGTAPPVICVASASQYQQRHVRGAKYAGRGETPEGRKDLEALAAELSKDSEVVLYCGCCPMRECPNIRPAYETLRRMGFRTIRVLQIPNNLHNDWTTKGYPCEPPQAPRTALP